MKSQMNGQRGRIITAILSAMLLSVPKTVYANQMRVIVDPVSPLPPPTIAPAFIECPNTAVDVPYTLSGSRLNLLHYNSLIFDITSKRATDPITYNAISNMIIDVIKFWKTPSTRIYSGNSIGKQMETLLDDIARHIRRNGIKGSDRLLKKLSTYNKNMINKIYSDRSFKHLMSSEDYFNPIWSSLMVEWLLNRQKIAEFHKNPYNKYEYLDSIQRRQNYIQVYMGKISKNISDFERRKLLEDYLKKMIILSDVYYISNNMEDSCTGMCKNSLIRIHNYIHNVIGLDIDSNKSYRDLYIIKKDIKYFVSEYRFYIFVIRSLEVMGKKYPIFLDNKYKIIQYKSRLNELFDGSQCEIIGN